MNRSRLFVLGTMLAICSGRPPLARAATDAQKVESSQKALTYLRQTQQAGGYWNSSGYEQAATGAATFAFLTQQNRWGTNSAVYHAAVNKAIAFLLNSATTTEVVERNDGLAICPDAAASCKAVYWDGNGEALYTTGLVARALAAYAARVGPDTVASTTGPLAGMSWRQIAQGITNAIAASQSTSRDGNKDGGWGGLPGNGTADSSNTLWAVIALLYNESVGANAPQAVKTDLKIWLGNVQNASGAACFQPGTEPCAQADTGGWLLAMKFVGYELSDSQIQSALAFLNTHWQSAANRIWYGNFGHPLAMWSAYTGLQTTLGLNDTSSIMNVLTDCGASTNETPGDLLRQAPCSWSEDYEEWLVKNQKPDGSWSGLSYWTDPIATALFVSILSQTEVPLQTSRTSEQGNAEGPYTTRLSTTGHSARPAAMANAIKAMQSTAIAAKLRPYQRKGITALAVKADGSTVASASSDNTIRLWSTTTGRQGVVLSGLLNLPTGVAFAPLGGTLSSVGRDSLVRIWDAGTGTALAKLAGHEHAIRSVAVSPDSRFLASAGEETRILMWDLTNRKLNSILFGPTDFVNSVCFSPDSRLLASGGEDARVLIYDVAAARLLHTLLGHAGPINTVMFSADGTMLASAGQDTVIHLWDSATGTQRNILRGHSAPIRSIAFSPDNRLLASGGEDTRIILWNTATGAIAQILTRSTGIITVLAFDPKGRFLASATDSGAITLWNVSTGAQLLTIAVP